jgi:3-phosphoinositide dependent protein kinase-1
MDLSEFSNDKYSRKDFEFLGSLASTPYGRIEKGKCIKDNKEYALKIFEKFHLQDPEALDKTRAEQKMLLGFKSPSPFVALHSTFIDSENVYFVMDYCPHGNLEQFMQRFSKFPFELARFYAGELVHILESLRSYSIIHCEINPINLLVSSDCHLYLTNFQNVYNQKYTRSSHSSQNENPEYLSPESLEGEYLQSGDVWSVACIIYQMLAGKSPFVSSTNYLTFDKIRSGAIEFPGILPPFAIDLINSMLAPDPTLRLGSTNIEDLKNHIFFQGLDIDSIYSSPAPDYRHEMSKDINRTSRVIMEGIVKKKAGWIYKKRLLVITEEPKITYWEPSRKEFRGEIAISPQLRGEIKNKIDFNIITPKRTYYFKVINDTPDKWVKAVAELLHKVYG